MAHPAGSVPDSPPSGTPSPQNPATYHSPPIESTAASAPVHSASPLGLSSPVSAAPAAPPQHPMVTRARTLGFTNSTHDMPLSQAPRFHLSPVLFASHYGIRTGVPPWNTNFVLSRLTTLGDSWIVRLALMSSPAKGSQKQIES